MIIDVRMARLPASLERGLRRFRDRLAAAVADRDAAIARLNEIAADIAAIDGQLEILPEGADRDALLASRETLVEEDATEREIMTEAESSVARIEAQIAGAEADLAAITEAAADVFEPKPEVDAGALAAEGRRWLDQYDALGAEHADLTGEWNDLIANHNEMVDRYEAIWAEGSGIYEDGAEANALYAEQDEITDILRANRERLKAIDARLDAIDGERGRIAAEMDALAERLLAAEASKPKGAAP